MKSFPLGMATLAVAGLVCRRCAAVSHLSARPIQRGRRVAAIAAFAGFLAFSCDHAKGSLTPEEATPTTNTDVSSLITTGCGYDAWTGSTRRVVHDIFPVAGSIGGGGLKIDRTYSSHGYSSLSYRWFMTGRSATADPVERYVVSFPDGRQESFHSAADSGIPGETAWRSNLGTKERLFQYGDQFAPTGTADLWLEDGSIVHFNRESDFVEPQGGNSYWLDYFTVTGISDPHGLLTKINMVQIPGTFEPNQRRIYSVVDATGQHSLQYNYNDNPVPAVALTSITASDGQFVQYSPMFGNPETSVTYSDGTSANYTYNRTESSYIQKDSGLTLLALVLKTAQDTRADGPMRSIQYTYPSSAVPEKFSGQVASEQHYPDGINVSTFTSDDARTMGTDTRGDGPSRTFNMTKETGKSPLMQWKTDFDGVKEYFYYDGYKYLNEFKDRNKTSTLYTNEPILGQPTTITHPNGSFADSTTFGTSTNTYTYSYGRFISPANPYFVASIKDDRGNTTFYDRDSLSRITLIRYPDGATETFTYNKWNEVSIHKRKNGWYDFADYNLTNGQLTTLWNPVNSSTHPVTPAPKTSYTYYPTVDEWAGRVQTETDPNGNHITYEYDLSFVNGVQSTTPCSGRGLVTKIKYTDDTHGGTVSGGTAKTFGYNKYGDKIWEKNESLEQTTYTYDDYGRLKTVKLPVTTAVPNATTTYDYTPTSGSAYARTANAVSLETSPSGVQKKTTYDNNVRKVTETDGYGVGGVAATTYFDYDANGNETKMTDPRGASLGDANHTTTTAFDSRNRKTRVTSPPAPTSQVTDWKYDASGNVTSIKRADGSIETMAYDEMDRMITDTVPKTASPLVNIITQFDYNPSGTMQKVTDGNGNAVSFLYNGYDLKTQMTYPSPYGTQQWFYDNNNNVLQWKNPGGNYQTFIYDERNRKLSMNWYTFDGVELSWATGTDWATYTYNVAGRMTVADNQNSKVTRTWDHANRLLSDAQDIKDGTFPSHTVNYAYRADGKIIEMDTDGGTNYDFLFDYDGMGRLEKLQYVLDTGTDYQYYYDKASNVTKRHNWIDQGTNVTFTYDNLNRISERDIYVPTTQIPRGWFSKEHYGYDAMNRLTSVLRDEDAKTDTFTYYLDGEMSGAHYGNNVRNVTYNLDKGGNRTSVVDGTTTTYVPDAINRYTTVGGNSLTYVGGHSLSAYLGENYYNIAGRQLCKAVSGGNTLLLYYDALGRCVRKSLNGVSTYRIFDGDHWIRQFSSNNSETAHVLYGLGIDEVIAGYNGDAPAGSEPQFFMPDRNGNISVILNQSGGVEEFYHYDAFGAPSFYGPSGYQLPYTVVANSTLFTGREWDADFGFYEYRARAYDPDLGRFISEDPKGFEAGDYNLYRYVSNDPLDKTDPMGLDATRDFIAGVGDAVTFGQAEKVAEFFYPGYIATVDKSSGAYRGASYVGLAAGMVSGEGEAGAARAVGKKVFSTAGKDAARAAAEKAAINPKIYTQLEKQLAKDGPSSITKSLQSAEKTLAEHQEKLAKLQAEGGYTSKVETTIKNVEKQIETIKIFQKNSE